MRNYRKDASEALRRIRVGNARQLGKEVMPYFEHLIGQPNDPEAMRKELEEATKKFIQDIERIQSEALLHSINLPKDAPIDGLEHLFKETVLEPEDNVIEQYRFMAMGMPALSPSKPYVRVERL